MKWKISTEPVPYEAALDGMQARVKAIHEEGAKDMVWLLEHPPLYTAGTSARAQDLLDPRFPVYEAGRGGEYTYHGPGQRVGYVMLDLKKRQEAPDIKRYVWQLEEWIIRALAAFDVEGMRRDGRIGIWVDTPQGEKKIAALGVRVRHWITFHGVSINVDPDLSHFTGIVPCGISEYGVTSLKELGKTDGQGDFGRLDEALAGAWDGVFA